MSRALWLPSTVAASAAAMSFLWLTSMPLGIPSEWTWPRLPADEQTGLNLLLAGVAAAGYTGLIALGGRRLARPGAGRVEVRSWLVGLFAAAVMWLWVVQETAPPAGQFAKGPFVLYYPSSSGYFYRVRYQSPNVREFLADYEELMSEGDVLHVGTHPPGLFLVFHGLIAAQATLPGLTNWLGNLAPVSFQDAMEIVRENTAPTPHPATSGDGVTLWLAYLLVLVCAAATVWPLYALLRFQLSRPAAWYSAALWPTVPALAMFVPKSDAAYPFLATILVWLTVASWKWKSRSLSFIAGLGTWLCLMASLAFLPVLLFAGLFVILDRRRTCGWTRPSRAEVGWFAACVVGFVAPVGVIGWFTGLNLPIVWLWNYRNHAGFYDQFPRTWWAWLLENPIELTFAVGIPTMSLAAGGAAQQFRDRPVTGVHLAAWVGMVVWGLLWLSGKNSGESARLWLLLTPGVIWLAGHGLFDRGQSALSPRIDPAFALKLLVLQLAVCVLTVHRVGGFHLSAAG